MTKSAMNNAMRTHEVMEYAQIRLDAQAKGYKFSSNVICPACEEEMELAIQSVGYTGTRPQWANACCAAKFYRKNKPHVVACGCGYRGTMKIKFTPIEKPKCKVRGCSHILNKTDTDGLCVPCRKEIAGGGNPATYSQHCTLKPSGCTDYIQGGNADCVRVKCKHYDPISAVMESKIKLCNRVDCTNPVPVGRTAVCFSCQPPPKEPASSELRI
jgi:hypothetical protein